MLSGGRQGGRSRRLVRQRGSHMNMITIIKFNLIQQHEHTCFLDGAADCCCGCWGWADDGDGYATVADRLTPTPPPRPRSDFFPPPPADSFFPPPPADSFFYKCSNNNQHFCAKFGTVMENQQPNGSQCSEILFSSWISILAHNSASSNIFCTKCGTMREKHNPRRPIAQNQDIDNPR